MPDIFFSIPVLLPDLDVLSFLSVRHTGELFEMEVLGDPVSIIRNGDNSWSLLEGDISEETLNVIGQAIKEHYLKER